MRQFQFSSQILKCPIQKFGNVLPMRPWALAHTVPDLGSINRTKSIDILTEERKSMLVARV